VSSVCPDNRALGGSFWSAFAANLLLCLVTGVATPQLIHYAERRLGAAVGVAGLIVGASSLAAIGLRAPFGRAADRYGMRPVAVCGCLGVAAASVVLMFARTIPIGTAGRVLLGLSGAAANTALTAWVVELAPPAQRGRALGIFGVGVWIGLAAGPPIGQALLTRGGYVLLWTGVGVLGLAGCVALLAAGASRSAQAHRSAQARRTERANPTHSANPTHLASSGIHRSIPRPVTAPGEHPLGEVARLVARPGIASAIAWSAEGTVLAFLAQHLERHGLSAGGPTGATSVFTVFALTVIVARLGLNGVLDRLGATVTSATSLMVVSAGLVALAFAATFVTAAGGAVLLGIGFAPLYPSLALLATARVPEERRALGIGIFTAYMDAGIAAGAALSGLIVSALGTQAALLAAAAIQFVAVALLLGASPPQASSDASSDPVSR
jgi:MFS family permease